MSTISASTTSITAYKVTADTTGTLVFQTGATPTTAITISTGQVATFAQAPSLPAASIPQAALAAGVAGNGPAFNVWSTAGTSATTGTFTKVQFDTKTFDTNTNYNTSTYRFTPTVAGYYQFNATVPFSSIGTAGQMCVSLYKNGTRSIDGMLLSQTATASCYSTVSGILYCNGSTDYVEVYGYQSTGSTQTLGGGSLSQAFTGAMVRSA